MTTFSIVTVCHNEAASLVGTAKSVFDQTFADYQFVVEDRASTDHTVDVAMTYGDWIDDFRSDPDAGKSEAMNRALGRCKGRFTLFLDAGVRFASPDVLAKVAGQLLDADDIVSGQAISVETGKVQAYRDPDLFWSGPILDLQSTFVRSDPARELLFDGDLVSAAALDFFSRARLRGAQVRMIDVAVCRKSFGLTAASDDIAGLAERHRVLMKHFGETHAVDATLRGELAHLIAERFGALHRLDALKQMSVPQLLQAYAKLSALLEKPGGKR